MPRLHEPARCPDLVVAALRRFPFRVAFRQDGRDLTYAETADRLARWVGVLHRRGFRGGDGVGVLSPNRPEVWLGQTAAPFAGGRFTALHPLGWLDDHRYACDEAELRFLFVDPAHVERAAALASACPSVEAVFTFGPAEFGEDIAALADRMPPAPIDDGGPHGAEDIAWLLYTGGTTGVPKAAMLPERALTQMVMSVLSGWDLPREKRYLACAPISHAAGMRPPRPLASGAPVVLPKSSAPGGFTAGVSAERITLSLLLPTMIYAMLDHPARDGTALSSLETIMSGASPISPTRLAEGIR